MNLFKTCLCFDMLPILNTGTLDSPVSVETLFPLFFFERPIPKATPTQDFASVAIWLRWRVWRDFAYQRSRKVTFQLLHFTFSSNTTYIVGWRLLA